MRTLYHDSILNKFHILTLMLPLQRLTINWLRSMFLKIQKKRNKLCKKQQISKFYKHLHNSKIDNKQSRSCAKTKITEQEDVTRLVFNDELISSQFSQQLLYKSEGQSPVSINRNLLFCKTRKTCSTGFMLKFELQ